MTADYHREEVDCIMMLYPAMSKLNAVVPNRYLLVNVVARRARQIAEDAEIYFTGK